MQPMRVLFVENADSFSWNVIERLPVAREDVVVVSGRNRAGISRAMQETRSVVIGPGPLDPIRAGLVDLVHDVASAGLPLLGICLGHQAIALAFGARLIRVEPCHGKRSRVSFDRSRCLPGIDGEHEVMRYHSLAVTDVTAPLQVTARTADGIVMAVEHESAPIAGLQFHPDSFGTPAGRAMLATFFKATT